MLPIRGLLPNTFMVIVSKLFHVLPPSQLISPSTLPLIDSPPCPAARPPTVTGTTVFDGTGLFGPITGEDVMEHDALDQQVTAAIGSKLPQLSMIPATKGIVLAGTDEVVPSRPQLQWPAT